MKYILYYLLIGILIDIVFILIIKLRNYITNGETVENFNLFFKDIMIPVITMPVIYPIWILLFIYICFLFIILLIDFLIEDALESDFIQNIKNKLF